MRVENEIKFDKFTFHDSKYSFKSNKSQFFYEFENKKNLDDLRFRNESIEGEYEEYSKKRRDFRTPNL